MEQEGTQEAWCKNAEWQLCSKRRWGAGPQVCASWARSQVWAGDAWQLRTPLFQAAASAWGVPGPPGSGHAGGVPGASAE